MQLRLGKMTSREIAQWMNISYNTYSHHINEKLDELSFYAEFEKVYGGVVIKKIYTAEYTKGAQQEMDKVYARLVLEAPDYLTSISGMIRYLKDKQWKKYEDISESTLRYRLTKAGIRTFGRTAVKEDKGYCGSRAYVWAIKVDDYNHYRFMTEEERSYLIQLTNSYSNNLYSAEAVWDIEFLQEDYEEGEISAEEYLENIKGKRQKDFYEDVLLKFLERWDCLPVKTTRHEVEVSIAKRLLGIED